MTFEYGDYLQQCFSKHLPSLLIFGAGFLYLLIGSLRLLRKGDFKGWLPVFSTIILLPTLICFMLFVPAIIAMTRTGGIHLPFEKPQDAYTATGILQKIEPEGTHASTGCKFHWDGKTVHGTWLTMADERYFAVSAGDLVAGDAVLIEYLPKSRCVLYLAPLDATPQED